MVKVDFIGGEGLRRKILIIDDKKIDNAYVRYSSPRSKLRCYVSDEEASHRLRSESFLELARHFRELEVVAPFDLVEMLPEVRLVFEEEEGVVLQALLTSLRPKLAMWSKPWSFQQYANVFDAEVLRIAEGRLLKAGDVSHELAALTATEHAYCLVNFDLNAPLDVVLMDVGIIVRAAHEATEKHLTSNLNRGSLVTFFDFPLAVRVACEQYLQYFIQFLDDLGIEADSEITSDAGRVLFAVTPKSGEEALASIKQALEAYLVLPKGDAAGAFDPMGGDVALNQLRANVSHLQSQLYMAQAGMQLANATLEAREERIQAQAMQISMFQRGQMITGSTDEARLITSEKGSSVGQDSEPLIGSLVKVTTLKVKGLEVDLPNLLRKLKRQFRSNKR